MALSLHDVVAQSNRHRYFSFGCLTQRHTDGVAKAIAQQRTNAHSRLDTTILAFSCLGDTQVERELHPFFLHLLHQEANGANHDDRIARLDGDDNIAEILLHADAKKLHARLHHAFGRIAIARHDAVGKRTVVHTDAHSRVMLLADVEKRHKAGFQLCQFVSILSIGIFQVLELAGWVHVIAWIDAHLLCIKSRFISHVSIEMHVGNKRHLTTTLAQSLTDELKVFRLFHPLRSETHILATCFHNAERLSNRAFRVHRGRVRHRLHSDGITSSQRSLSDVNLVGRATLVVEKRIPIARTNERFLWHDK